MEADPQELKREYAGLSDEGLLAIDRADLTDLALPYYDAELAKRGLQPVPEKQPEAVQPAAEDDWVNVATFLSIEEADLGRTLLQSADIPVFLENEMNPLATNGLRLMVPSTFAEQAEEILESRISDEDLIAQAEAAAPPAGTPEEEVEEEKN